MQKYFYLSAALALVLTSCASDDIVDQGSQQADETAKSISFNLQTPTMTRATETGSTAASKLSNRFVVWGEKNEADDGSAAAATNLVFKNYKVDYTSSTAYTTTSNTKDWEYVGYTPYSQIGPDALTVAQTIKYWDYSASSYTFTAISALDADITGGKVVINKIPSGTTVYDKGYTVTVKEGAALDNIYFADRLNIAAGTGTNREAVNAYGGNVTLTFRNFMSKIRFAIYETIPGYKVNIEKVYYNSSSSAANFGVDGNFIIAGDNTKFTVSYEDNESANENKVMVKADASSSTKSYFETTNSTINSATELGVTSNAATFDKAEKAYTTILPNPANTTNIKLKIDYKLTSTDTGETINVKGATAEVPSQYCQWKSNYAYTYIFKISDNTNGSTGGDVVGLYPITFDATVITDETGKQETITTVSEPSITTMGYDATTKKIITDENAYNTGNVIYASVVEGGSVVTLSATNAKLYTVTTTDATNFPITEASVAESLAEDANATSHKIKATAATATYDTSVPAEDGTTRTLSNMHWTAAENTVYAVEYIKDGKKTYKVINIAAATGEITVTASGSDMPSGDTCPCGPDCQCGPNDPCENPDCPFGW